MKRLLALLLLAMLAAPAHAQIKCWTGADGKRACGDTPPPGAKVTTVRTPPPAGAPAPAAKDAKKGPLTPAEQEQEFRKRQQEAQKSAEKQAQAEQEAARKKEGCARAQENLRFLESGQRIARTDASGERYYLDDAQREQEIARVRDEVRRSCN
jgi:hypothetical protein